MATEDSVSTVKKKTSFLKCLGSSTQMPQFQTLLNPKQTAPTQEQQCQIFTRSGRKKIITEGVAFQCYFTNL